MIGKHPLILGVAVFFLWVPTALCIDVGTSVASVSHEGRYEVVGSFSLTLTDDELAQASPDTPIYIRFGTNRSNGWSKTIVDLRDDDGVAINLALYPVGGSRLNPTIPGDAVQLVRMVAGESAAWIKITRSTSDWMLVGGVPAPPSSSSKVGISLGIRGSISVRDGGSTISGGNEYADDNQLADTRLIVDYFQTPDFNNGDRDALSIVAFDHETRGVESGQPINGNLTGIGFSNDLTVARAVNHFPCYEYHFAVDNFDTPAHEVQLSLLDLIQRRTYRAPIPAVYLTNSSDFAWEPGSTFFLTHTDYNPTYTMEDSAPPSYYNPQPPTTHLLAVPLTVTVGGTDTWEISEVWQGGGFMGYRFELTAGEMAVYDALKIEGLRIGTLFDQNATEGDPLELTAWAWYFAQGVNSSSEPQALSPLTARTANLSLGGVTEQSVLPYAAFDREDLSFNTHLANPHDEAVRVTTLVYHPFGILEEVVGDVVLPPHGQMTLAFDERWPEEKRKHGWVAVYSDRAIAVVGELIGRNGTTLDIIAQTTDLSESLYAPHITADSVWETHAYMVSADPAVDPSFTYRGSETVENTRIPGFLIPSGTGDLTNDDFDLASGRIKWFEVDAVEPTGAGLLFYGSTQGGGMMATVPMLGETHHTWRYDHVGNPQGGWWNGIVLTNPLADTNAVVLSGYNSIGELLGTSSFELAPEQRRVDIIANLLPMPDVARVEAVGSGPLLSFLLLGRVEGDRVTTIPGNLEAAHKLAMPYFPSLASHWVGLAMINNEGAAVTVTLTPYLPSGIAGTPVTLEVAPGGKTLFNLADFVDPNGGYGHLTLQASSAIKAYALTGSTDNSRLATLPLKGVSTP